MLITSNLANIAATALITVAATKAFGDAWVGIATGAMTLLILIFGEIVPKNIAISHATRVALVTAPIFQFLMLMLKPVVIIFELISKVAVKLFGGDEWKSLYSEDDLKTLVEVGVSENQVEEEDQKRIEWVLNLDNLEAQDIMTPRTKMFVIESGANIEDVYEKLLASGYSRIPVIGEDKDDIVGILYLRDYLTARIEKEQTSILDIIKEPLFIGEYETIWDIFHVLQRQKRHIAIVQDEYGGTAGLITLEDIIEEITGDIVDETDFEDDKRMKKISPDCYIVNGDVEIDEINELFSINIDREDDFNTISGYLQSESDEVISATGYTETINDLRFEVLEMEHSKPSKIKIQKLER